MTTAEDCIASEDVKTRNRCKEDCYRHVQALHRAHPEQWRQNLIKLREAKAAHAQGLESGTGCATSAVMRSKHVEIRSSGNGEAV